jgi:nucleoside recognition membrane protein YjiH
MEASYTSEMSTSLYKTIRCHDPEHHNAKENVINDKKVYSSVSRTLLIFPESEQKIQKFLEQIYEMSVNAASSP